MLQKIKSLFHFALICRLVKRLENDFANLTTKSKKIDASWYAKEAYFLIPLKHKKNLGGKVTRENLQEKLESFLELFQ